jgi:protein phosphatase
VLRAHGLTDKGPVRPVNEDCLAIDDGLSLCIVADGMGGHNAGEVASRIAVDTVLDVCRGSHRSSWPFGFDPAVSEAGNLLRTSVHIASVRVCETADLNGRYSGMGTTIVAALVREGRLSAAHVGDSRLYVFDGTKVRLLTRDDSWMESMLLDNPQADVTALQHHPMRNALTNVVGADRRTEVHIIEEAIEDGTILLLTTDGVHGVLDDQRIETILANAASPSDMTAALIGAALTCGTRDNCTAVAAQYVAL